MRSQCVRDPEAQPKWKSLKISSADHSTSRLSTASADAFVVGRCDDLASLCRGKTIVSREVDQRTLEQNNEPTC